MNINKTINTRDEAEQFAITFQDWASKENLSYTELAEWQARLEELAERFDLVDDFRENGII